MEPLIEFSLAATRWLQETYPQLEGLMLLFDQLGRFEFYLIVIPLLYWCIDKHHGKSLAYLLAISHAVNVFLKHALRAPRPYWLESDLTLGTEPRYGVPSGHSQNAMVTYLYIGYWLRRGWVWALCALMILVMGFSRVYLGVHYLHDVLAGYLIGAVLFAGFVIWQRYFHSRFRNRILGQRLLAAITIPVVFALLYTVMRLLMGAPNPDVAWSEHIAAAELISIEDAAVAIGALAGLGVGFVLEASRVYFLVHGSLSKRVVRYLLGIAVTILLWRGLGLLFPSDSLWLAIPLRVLRYALVGLWVSYYAPWFFVRFRLAEASSGPDVGLSVSDGSIMRG